MCRLFLVLRRIRMCRLRLRVDVTLSMSSWVVCCISTVSCKDVCISGVLSISVFSASELSGVLNIVW